MKQIAIFGAGGFGREVKMLIDDINKVENEWKLIGFFDDGLTRNTRVVDFPVLGGVNELNEFPEDVYVVLAVGDPLVKESIVQRIRNQRVSYPILIHPSVIIGNGQDNQIGEGTIITAGNIITVNTYIGRHVILNLACTVGHDSEIHDFSSLMPSVNVSGEVVIAKSCFIGTGAKIINQKKIGSECIVGAGAVVTSDLPDRCTAVGAPAKPIKFR